MKSQKVKKYKDSSSSRYISVSKKRYNELLKSEEDFKKLSHKRDLEIDTFNKIIERQENEIGNLITEKRELRNTYEEYISRFESTYQNIEKLAVVIQEEEKKEFNINTNVGLYINLHNEESYLDNYKIDLSPKERRLLYYFALNNKEHVLLEKIYKFVIYDIDLKTGKENKELKDSKGYLSYNNTAAKYINRLRKVLEKNKRTKILYDGLLTKGGKEYMFSYRGNIKLIDEDGKLQ